MAFVNAKCPNCGASLTVNGSNDAAICQYCNTPFIVSKAVNNYNVQAQIVNLNGQVSTDFELYDGVLIKYHGKSIHPIIPNGVREIGEYAFAGEEREKIKKSTIKLIDEKTFKPYNETTEYSVKEWTGLPIISVDIPDTVHTIKDFAFKNCDKLQEIRIPSSVSEIEYYAFDNCTGTLIIGEGTKVLKKISSDFTGIVLPDSITEIEQDCHFIRIEYIKANFPFTCTVTVKKLFRAQKEQRTFSTPKEMIKFFTKI